MKFVRTSAVALLTIVALSGCTSSAELMGGDSVAPSTATATPVPTPTAVEMTTGDAAEYYLDTVCPANAAADTWNQLSPTAEFATVQAAARPVVDAYSAAAARFDDQTVIWPDVVDAADIDALSNDYYASISVLQGVANASSEAEAVYDWPNSDAAAAASQRIRARLSLPSDTAASCTGR